MRKRNEEGFLVRQQTDFILITASDTPNGEEKTDKQLKKLEQFEGRMSYGSHYFIHIDGDVAKGRPHDSWASYHVNLDDVALIIRVLGTTEFNEAQVRSAHGLAEWLTENHYPDATICWDLNQQEQEYL